MTDPKKTKEEIEAELQATIEEAENLPDTPEEDDEEETPDEETPKETKDEEKVEEKEESEEEIDEEDKTYREKFTQSTREAQILAAREKKLHDAIEAGKSIPEPTDEEMAIDFPDWDVMSETERKLAKKVYVSDKRSELLEEVTKESKDYAAWNDKVDKFLDNPQSLIDNPELEGKVDEFKVFATKPTRRGVDFETLVSSFLWEAGKTIKKNKGKQMETGTGGPNDKPDLKGDKISTKEAASLMKKDYKKYKELLLAGKIDTSDIH